MFSFKVLDRVRWIVGREYGELTPSEKRAAGKLIQRGFVVVMDDTIHITDYLREELRSALVSGELGYESESAATEILHEACMGEDDGGYSEWFAADPPTSGPWDLVE